MRLIHFRHPPRFCKYSISDGEEELEEEGEGEDKDEEDENENEECVRGGRISIEWSVVDMLASFFLF